MTNQLNNSSTSGDRRRGSCAACLNDGVNCKPSCLLKPYFPTVNHKPQYLKVHKMFGRINIEKMLREVAPERREDTMKSIIYEANTWDFYPGRGCLHLTNFLKQRLHDLGTELTGLHHQLANYRNQLEIRFTGQENEEKLRTDQEIQEKLWTDQEIEETMCTDQEIDEMLNLEQIERDCCDAS